MLKHNVQWKCASFCLRQRMGGSWQPCRVIAASKQLWLKSVSLQSPEDNSSCENLPQLVKGLCWSAMSICSALGGAKAAFDLEEKLMTIVLDYQRSMKAHWEQCPRVFLAGMLESTEQMMESSHLGTSLEAQITLEEIMLKSLMQLSGGIGFTSMSQYASCRQQYWSSPCNAPCLESTYLLLTFASHAFALAEVKLRFFPGGGGPHKSPQRELPWGAWGFDCKRFSPAIDASKRSCKPWECQGKSHQTLWR